jgi:hypothetical protein
MPLWKCTTQLPLLRHLERSGARHSRADVTGACARALLNPRQVVVI